MTVRVYRSTDYGHPVLTGTAGDLLKIMDILVDGYGNNSISALTQTGGVATATCVNAHGMPLGRSAVRSISGANETGYNKEVTVTSTGTNTFTYPVIGGTPSSATGAPSVRCDGSGWTRPFPKVGNVGVYRQPTAGANGRYLRVDDNAVANIARVIGYETMASLSSGSGGFPTETQFAGGLYAGKSASSDAVERQWKMYCNGPMVYLVINVTSAADWGTSQIMAFGDYPSNASGDQFNTLIIAGTSSTVSSSTFQALVTGLNTAQNGHFSARSFSQIGTSVALNKGADNYFGSGQAYMGASGAPYPCPVDGGLYVSAVRIGEIASPLSDSVPRGILPGVYSPLHARPMADGDIWVPTGDLAGKTFEAVNSSTQSQILFEISDTW